MATMDVTLPDGTVLQGIPEGTTKAQIAAKIKSSGRDVPDSWMDAGRKSPRQTKDQYDARMQEENAKVVAGMGTGERLAAGAGKAIYDTARGIGQIFGKESKEDIAQSRSQDQALMNTMAARSETPWGTSLKPYLLPFSRLPLV